MGPGPGVQAQCERRAGWRETPPAQRGLGKLGGGGGAATAVRGALHSWPSPDSPPCGYGLCWNPLVSNSGCAHPLLTLTLPRCGSVPQGCGTSHIALEDSCVSTKANLPWPPSSLSLPSFPSLHRLAKLDPIPCDQEHGNFLTPSSGGGLGRHKKGQIWLPIVPEEFVSRNNNPIEIHVVITCCSPQNARAGLGNYYKYCCCPRERWLRSPPSHSWREFAWQSSSCSMAMRFCQIGNSELCWISCLERLLRSARGSEATRGSKKSGCHHASCWVSPLACRRSASFFRSGVAVWVRSDPEVGPSYP